MRSISTLLLTGSLALTGCSTLHMSAYSLDKDPLEPINRKVYAFNDSVDRAAIKPAAQVYAKVVPTRIKTMVNNFFDNIDDVNVTANDLLQAKFNQAANDGGRVLFNTTFGIFGLFEITNRLEKHNEDFGQTLGYWGVNSGCYLVLPFWGPSSLRDGVGLYADSKIGVISNTPDVPVRNSAWAFSAFNTRVNLLDQEKVMDEATIDRYSFMRDAYLMHRQNLVYDGNPPRQKYDDED